MIWFLRLFVASLIAACAPSAIAEDATRPSAQAPGAKSEENPAALRLLRLFSQFCLQKFPDDMAVASEANEAGAAAMPAGEVKALLQNDPGRGWTLDLPEGHFRIVLESLPYHACGIRSFGEAPLVSKLDLPLMKFHAAQSKHALSKPLLLPNRLNGGVSVVAGYDVINEDGSAISPKESFMIVIDSYVAPSDPKQKVETRLVRQIVP
jgi:hypothetical protein